MKVAGSMRPAARSLRIVSVVERRSPLWVSRNWIASLVLLKALDFRRLVYNPGQDRVLERGGRAAGGRRLVGPCSAGAIAPAT